MSAINLEKGQKVDLTKGSDSTLFYVGLGWDAPQTVGGHEYDLDVSAILLNEQGTILDGDSKNFVFYGNLDHASGGIHHTGDNRTGAGDGDDEVLIIDTSKLPANAQEVSFIVTIHDAAARGQNFGSIKNAFVRLVPANADKTPNNTGQPNVRYDLNEDYSMFTAIQVGSIYRKDAEWKFDAVGQGFKADLRGVLTQYGAQVA
jgi:tellurium resistance protein TerD